MKTLAEINQNAADHDWIRGNYIFRPIYAVGGMNMSFSTYRTGTKVHFVSGDVVVGYTDPNFVPARGMAKIGSVVGLNARCNGNGQSGTIFKGLDTDAINCKRCCPARKESE